MGKHKGFLVTDLNRRVRCFCIVLLSLLGTIAQGQAQQILKYHYDNAGNIIGISDYTDKVPVIDHLMPSYLRKGISVTAIATGDYLEASRVSANEPGLIISDVSSREDQVVFHTASD